MITREIIVDSLSELSYWRDAIQFRTILDYIKDRFSVNPNLTELEIELRWNLEDAQKAGIVKSDGFDAWRLCTSLEQLRHIPETQLSLFWPLDCETINPLSNKSKFKENKMTQTDDYSSDSDSPSDG